MENVEFELEKAVIFAKLSDLAYKPFEKDVGLLKEPLKALGFSLVGSPFNSPDTQTQGYLATNGRFAVLCFRGTEANYFDILTDLRARLLTGKDSGEHSGFFSAFESISSHVKHGLNQVSNLPVYATGHSLGGALAKVSILELPDTGFSACYTFGSPAICDEQRAKDNQVPVFLVVNAADAVPRILSLSPTFVRIALGIMKILRPLLCRIFRSVEHWDRWITELERLLPDLHKYEHFGAIHFIGQDGSIQKLPRADSLRLFFGIVGKNWKRSFEDHAIAGYIASLSGPRSVPVPTMDTPPLL